MDLALSGGSVSDLSWKDQGSRRCLLLLQGAALQQHAVTFTWAGLSCPALLLRSQETGLLFVPSALNGDERGYAHRQSLRDSQASVGSKTNLTQNKGDRRKMKANVPGFYALLVSLCVRVGSRCFSAKADCEVPIILCPDCQKTHSPLLISFSKF